MSFPNPTPSRGYGHMSHCRLCSLLQNPYLGLFVRRALGLLLSRAPVRDRRHDRAPGPIPGRDPIPRRAQRRSRE